MVGYSQGAHMAHRLACDSADLVSAVVGIAGQLQDCAPVRPVSALTIHGTEDEAISYTEGSPGAVETISTWARADGCTGALEDTGQALDLTTLAGSETTVQAFTGCPEGIDVELFTMNGVQHGPEWTSALPEVVVGFLEAHPRK